MPDGGCGEYDRSAPRDYTVAFLTADKLREIDADPVLEPADYWDGGRL